MYQALYRKFRPRSFSDVIGQVHITQTLSRQIVSDRLSHAYLFVGTRGTGKTTCAKILSRAVNCLSPVDGNPCNSCSSCLGIEDGSILDVLEIDAASNNKVDDVRTLLDEAVYTPATVKKRVYIIDEVHMLTIQAFNALLKMLEEPPAHILFILATTELHKVPPTIQSRCQRFSFKRLSPSAIAGRLCKIASSEGLDLTADAAERLASLADGSMRDGESLLDQCAADKVIDLQHVQDTLGLAGKQELIRLAEAAADRDTAAALGILDTLYSDGKDMASLLSELTGLFRDLLVYKLAPDCALIDGGISRSELSALSKRFLPERLFLYLEVLKDAMFNLSRSGISKLLAEMSLIRLCDERLSDDIAALASRISKIEAGGITVSAVETPLSVSGDEPGTGIEVNAEPESSGVTEPVVTPLPASGDDPGPCIEALTDPEPDFEINIELEPCIETNINPEPSAVTEPARPVDFWAEILRLLEDQPAVRALLSDSSKVHAKLDGNALLINMADAFNADMIKSEYMAHLTEAAENALERKISVRVEAGISNFEEDKRSKLESLSAFGVTFE